VVLATRHDNSLVKKNQIVAGAKVIPLTIDKSAVEQVEAICAGHEVIRVSSLQSLPVGIIVTGSEVCQGLIPDRFGPVLIDKVHHYGCTLVGIRHTEDNADQIKDEIEDMIALGSRLVMVSGGMSVDADDITPQAIAQSCDQIITYGSPVLPGAMFMLAYRQGIPILGVPACGMFHRITVLDLVLPRILAGERLTKRDLTRLAHGGLCQNCDPCHYPDCAFGK